MKRRFFVLLLAATFLLSASASSAGTALTEGRTIRVKIDLDLYVAQDGAFVRGATNLPSGSELIVGLADQAYARRQGGYYGQSKVVVRRGKFHSERFTNRGTSLAPGRYRVDVSMSWAFLQPQRVQAVIGRPGQALTGPLVDHDPSHGASVDFEQWFVLR